VVLQKDGSLRFEFDRGHMTESAPIAWLLRRTKLRPGIEFGCEIKAA
jgi:hypothetical protein